MFNFNLSKESSGFSKKGKNFICPIVEGKTTNYGCFGQEVAAAIHRVIDLYSIPNTSFIVFYAVAGCSVNTASSRIEHDIISKKQGGCPIRIEWVDSFSVLKFSPFTTMQNFTEFQAYFLCNSFKKGFCQKIYLVSTFYKNIVVAWAKGYSHTGRESPRGCCPYHYIHIPPL